LEKNNANLENCKEELSALELNILSILDDLRIKEEFKSKPKAFPDIEIGEDLPIDYKFKIIVCGDPGVGKTSTVLRFTDNAFTTNYIPTLGVNISEKFIKFHEDIVDLVLWDVAGQVKFDRMRKHFYQGVDGILLVFDLTRPESFRSIEKWYNDIMKNIETEYEVVGFILGNKYDLVEQRDVDKDRVIALKERLNLDYFEISALTGHNINEVFSKITHEIIKTIDS
jgi:small GTP-binding protein